MGKNKILSFEYFPSLNNTEEFFKKITAEEGAGRRILNQLLLLSLFAFLYGVVMGSYHSLLQAIVAGVIDIAIMVAIGAWALSLVKKAIKGEEVELR